jgi:hypothetical protein
MSQSITRNEKIHCRELNTGTNHTGFFQIDDKQIRAELFSYDGYFHLNTEQPIFLQTHQNHIVSLHRNIDLSQGDDSAFAPNEMKVRHHHVLSNAAVIGRTKWSDTDRLKRVLFVVPQADGMLQHEKKRKQISGNRWEDYTANKDLFSLRVGANTYRSFYLATFSMDLEHATKIWPCFEIEFDAGATLSDYLDAVLQVVTFLGAVLAADLKPETIQILRLDRDEFEAAAVNNELVEAHSVEYIWPIKEHDLSSSWAGHFVRAWDDTYLATLTACLSAWIERYGLWKSANALMMASVRREGEMSPDRLLAACTWFEEIPTAKSVATMNSGDVEKITLSATQRAAELGYAKMENRVRGALTRLTEESRRDQLTRLVNGIHEKLGYQFASVDIIEHLHQAIQLRGKAAHGHLSIENDAEYGKLAKSTYAMEAFCFLLTVQDLPVDKKAIEQLGDNKFLRNYRLSF